MKKIAVFCTVLVLFLYGACSNAAKSSTPLTEQQKLLIQKSYLRTLTPPLYMGYFRTWHDRYSWLPDDASNKMSDVPKEVDVVFVFVDWTEKTSPFWDKLKNEYVPKLNKQGTWVVRTCGIKDVDGRRGASKDFDDANGIPTDEAGYEKLAQYIVAEYVDKYDLDGLDIDFERHDDGGEYAVRKDRIVGVIKALSKLLHSRNKLLILDTNKNANDDDGIFIATKDAYDYVLRQTYGYGWQTGFDTYTGHIPKNKYLTGFSFYEENGNSWNDVPSVTIVADDDTNAPRGVTVEQLMADSRFKGCHAYKMAEWAATGGYGGCFSYAIDRDGVRHGNNKKFFKVAEGGHPSQYLFSRALKKTMQEKYSE